MWNVVATLSFPWTNLGSWFVLSVHLYTAVFERLDSLLLWLYDCQIMFSMFPRLCPGKAAPAARPRQFGKWRFLSLDWCRISDALLLLEQAQTIRLNQGWRPDTNRWSNYFWALFCRSVVVVDGCGVHVPPEQPIPAHPSIPWNWRFIYRTSERSVYIYGKSLL